MSRETTTDDLTSQEKPDPPSNDEEITRKLMTREIQMSSKERQIGRNRFRLDL